MQHRRTPILGDDSYGSADWNRRFLRSHRIGRPLLHAYETQLRHPFEESDVTLTAPLPQDMLTMLAKIAPDGQNAGSMLVDSATGLLKQKFTVTGKEQGTVEQDLEEEYDVQENSGFLSKGFVPLDRLVEEEDEYDWTTLNLLEDDYEKSTF